MQQCCSRDESCAYTGECCMDAFKEEYTGKDYTTYFLERTSVKKYVKKVAVLNINLNPTHTVVRRFMISACGDFSSPYYRNCNFMYEKDDFPVYDRNRLVYRNTACARCHGKHSMLNDVEIIVTRCFENITREFQSLENLASCTFDINKPETYKILHRRDKSSFFNQDYHDAEGNCMEEERLLCENAMFPIQFQQFQFFNGNPWSNPLCRKCAMGAGIPKSIRCDARLYKNYLIYKMTDPSPPISVSVFALMMSRTYVGVIENTLDKKSVKLCEKGAVFDALLGQCVESKCQVGYKKVGGECVRVKAKLLVVNKRNMSRSVEDCLLGLRVTTIIYEYSRHSINESLFDENGTNIFTDNSSLYIFHQTSYQNPSHLWKNQRNESLKMIYHTPSSSPPVTSKYGFSPQHHISNGIICQSPTVTHDFNLTSDCNIEFNGIEYEVFRNGIFWLETSSNGTKTVTASLCTENKFFLDSNCSSSFLSDAKYAVGANNTIKLDSSGGSDIELKPEEYLPSRDGVYICVSKTAGGSDHKSTTASKYTFENLLWGIENTVARTMLIVSIICEVVLVITYISIDELMNTPGKMVVSISLVLMLTDMIVSAMYVLPLTEPACRIIAPLLHWLSLCLYLWSALLAYDIWKTFRKSFQRRSNENRGFLKLFALVSGVSSLVVGLALMLEHSGMFKVGYGKMGENACWITTLDGRLYLFLIPSYVILLLTVVLLVFIVTNIKRNMEPQVIYLISPTFLSPQTQLDCDSILIYFFLYCHFVLFCSLFFLSFCFFSLLFFAVHCVGPSLISPTTLMYIKPFQRLFFFFFLFALLI